MSKSYKNNTRHDDLELTVSRGQLDYQSTQIIGGTTYFMYNMIGDSLESGLNQNEDNTYRAADHHILPRLNLQAGLDVSQTVPVTPWGQGGITDTVGGNYFSNYVNEGADEVIGNDTYEALNPFISTHRIPYSSKIIPIFAQGTETNAPVFSNISCSTLDLLSIEIPYLKANILRGEITSVYPPNPSIENNLQGYFYAPIYGQYPIHNAIQVQICTKSLPPVTAYGNLRGGAWFKKTFLIHYDLVTFTETPFPGVFANTINRQYWRPVGLLPTLDYGTDGNWERYNVYVDDTTVTGTAWQNVSSSWLGDFYYASFLPLNNEPLEIIQSPDEKKATINIRAITVDSTGNLDHTIFSAKGLAKLI